MSLPRRPDHAAGSRTGPKTVDPEARAAGGRARRPPTRTLRLLAASLLLGFSGCLREEPEIGTTPLEFDRRGISLSLSTPALLRRVEVVDGQGSLLLSLPWPDLATARISVPFRWAPGASYGVRLRDAHGRTWWRAGTAPVTPSAPFDFELDLPHGSGAPAAPSGTRALAVGTRAEGTLRLTSRSDRPIQVDLSLEDEGVLVATEDAPAFPAAIRLEGPDDFWCASIAVRAPKGPARLVAIARCAGSAPVRLERTIVGSDHAALARTIELVDVQLPATASGIRDPRWQPDAIQLPGEAGSALLRLLGVRTRSADPYEPFTWQTVVVRNLGDAPVPLLFRARVVDERTGEPVPALSAPAAASGGSGESLQIAECPPGRETRVSLPVFVHAARVEEGRYRREIRALVLGTDRAVVDVRLPLDVRRTGTLAWASVGASFLLTGIALLLLARAGAGFWGTFRVRELVIVSLYGSVSFAAVALPGSLLASVLGAVLGPLSAVVTGLVGRVLGYMVLASMLRLVPRPGAAALATTIKWLLSAVLFGQLTAIAFLYLGTYVVLLEAACRAGGIGRWNREAYLDGARGFRAAALIGAADTVATFIDFQITVLLYRVFFADWYVWITVWLNGFVYSTAGAWLGFRLGREMMRVS